MPVIDVDALAVPAFSVAIHDDGALVFDGMNAPLLAITGLTREAVIGRTAHDFMAPEGASFFEANYRRCIASGCMDEYEEETILPVGRMWWRTTLSPVIDDNGKIIKVFGLCVDITARKLAELDIRSAAYLDPVTNISNRRRFDRDIENAVARSADTGRPFSLVIADIDRFKSINDTYGHSFGDEVLRQIAARPKSGIRETDKAARIGGDEFALIISAASEGAVAVALDRIDRQLLPSIASGNVETKVHTSIGTATWRAGLSVTDMMQAADAAMYEAKRKRAA